ncbi:hypothetical protein [Amycolatopsis sp. WGS_07]
MAQAFADKRCCSAIVDRLTCDGHMVETGTGSYRLSTPGPVPAY